MSTQEKIGAAGCDGGSPLSMNCRERVALVTGGSRGIGRATALALAQAGASVVVACREGADEARAVVAEIEDGGGCAAVVAADLRRSDEVDAMLRQAVAAFGRIDILVNNAGITRDNFMLFMKTDEWTDVLDVDLSAPFRLMKFVARDMIRRRWGRIINVASTAALMGDLRRTNYSAAKAGLLGLTRAAARELAPSGITVNAVAPGLIDTAMTAALDHAARDKRLAAVPLARFGSPADVAGAIVFLATDAAAYITGQVLGVDGGLHM